MKRGGRRLVTAVLFSILGAASATAVDLPDFPRQNPLLHKYFRQRLIESLSVQDALGRRIYFVDPVILDQRAYLLSSDFQRQVQSKVRKMRARFDEVEEVRRSAPRQTARLSEGRELRNRWSRLFKRISDEAGDLLGMLRPIIGEAEVKMRAKPEISSREISLGFEDEMRIVDGEITRAAERITQFLQGRDFTISVGELLEEDMLTSLQRVRVLTREISRRIEDAS